MSRQEKGRPTRIVETLLDSRFHGEPHAWRCRARDDGLRGMRMSGAISRLLTIARKKGPRAALDDTLARARSYALDERSILVLRVDLSNPQNRLRPRDLVADGFRLLPFDRAVLPRLLDAVQSHEPHRAETIRTRFLEGARGFVAEHRGEIAGHVFFTGGTGHSGRIVHSDLRWLGPSPHEDELYAFDYFLVPSKRGLGARFARAVQEEQWRMGFRGAYGYVFGDNTPAVWLYRTTGWVEVSRFTERRVLSRFVLVGETVYWRHPHARSPLLTISKGVGSILIGLPVPPRAEGTNDGAPRSEAGDARPSPG